MEFNLGRLLGATGDREGQAAAFRRAIEINPEFAEGHFFLAKALLDSGSPGLDRGDGSGAHRPGRSGAQPGHGADGSLSAGGHLYTTRPSTEDAETGACRRPCSRRSRILNRSKTEDLDMIASILQEPRVLACGYAADSRVCSDLRAASLRPKQSGRDQSELRIPSADLCRSPGSTGADLGIDPVPDRVAGQLRCRSSASTSEIQRPQRQTDSHMFAQRDISNEQMLYARSRARVLSRAGTGIAPMEPTRPPSPTPWPTTVPPC